MLAFIANCNWNMFDKLDLSIKNGAKEFKASKDN